MDQNASNSVNNNSEKEHKWVFTILSLPQIGGLLTTIVTLTPAAIFSAIFILIANPEESTMPGSLLILLTAILLIIMLLVTWRWLNYLERKLGLVILLPIPFINIRIKWLLYPFMLPFFGIRRIYQNLTTKHNMDNVDNVDNNDISNN